jgi:hypothetical protein
MVQQPELRRPRYRTEPGCGLVAHIRCEGCLIKIKLAHGTREVVTKIPEICFLRWANAAQNAILMVQREPINFLIPIDLNQSDEPERMMDYLPSVPRTWSFFLIIITWFAAIKS